MKYQNIVKGRFLERPNRFIAYVEVDGRIETVHVKNTGRCKELLIYGATVFLEKSENKNRKTSFDLISVYKGDKLINIDSQSPNKIFAEWVLENIPGIKLIKPEVKRGDSRFDFYIETDNERIFVEVKGVTLEENGVAMFPDAPTDRGIKHLNGLVELIKEGYSSMIVFVIQMEDANIFMPNCETHLEFSKALYNAENAGVKVLAIKCKVFETEIYAFDKVKVEIKK